MKFTIMTVLIMKKEIHFSMRTSKVTFYLFRSCVFPYGAAVYPCINLCVAKPLGH